MAENHSSLKTIPTHAGRIADAKVCVIVFPWARVCSFGRLQSPFVPRETRPVATRAVRMVYMGIWCVPFA